MSMDSRLDGPFDELAREMAVLLEELIDIEGPSPAPADGRQR